MMLSSAQRVGWPTPYYPTPARPESGWLDRLVHIFLIILHGSRNSLRKSSLASDGYDRLTQS